MSFRSLPIISGMAVVLAVAANAQSDAARANSPRHGNAITDWNTVAIKAFTPFEGTNPMAHSRILAILHASIHDALNAIDRRYASYTPGVPASPGASPEAAVASAARTVLVALFPEQSPMVNEAYARALLALPDGPAKVAGIVTGQSAAEATLARRLGDGAEKGAEPAYVPRPGPGEYQFTPPFTFAAQPGWGRVQPFIIDLKEHEVEGPQPLDSLQYTRDFDYLKAIGRIDSTVRTEEQSETAKFWYEDSTLGWNRIANTLVRRRRLDLWSAARVLALVNFAMADGFIAGFEAKYHFRFWRPETAIRDAAADGNPMTEPDPYWQPYMFSPPVPDYPSTHTVLGWAAAEVLMEHVGDRVPFSMTSLTLPGVTRKFRAVSQAAQENALSRIYAGIHFRHAVRDGRRQGRSIGRAVAEALEPVWR